jgi:signal transduction histidine kinase
LPQGRGILGLLISDARPLRLRDMREHPASVGVPRHHPAMRSFMGVPVVAGGRVFGNLYVTEKIGADEFSESDLDLLEVLATQAAVAIENAHLRAARDRLVAAASHALGNALAGVRLWSGTLLHSPPASQEEWMAGVRRIAGGAAQTTRLVEDLVALTEIQDGSVALEATEMDVAEVVRHAAAGLRTEIQAAGVSLDVNVAAPLVAELDAKRTHQILTNVMAHAVAMSPEGARVTVSAANASNGGVHLEVGDSGPSVSAEEAEALFEPQATASVHARGRGFGFELAVSRQLARLMGGDITATGRPEGGALFTLRLPRVMRSRPDGPSMGRS